MGFNFGSTNELPLKTNRRKRTREIRSGLVRASDIALGDVVFFTAHTDLTRQMSAGKGSLNRYGGYADVLHNITGLEIVETSGIVAVSHTAAIKPLNEYFGEDGQPLSGSTEWSLRIIKKLSSRSGPDALTAERVRSELIATSSVFMGGEVGIVPSVHALTETVGTGFATSYLDGMGYHGVLETVTGLSMYRAGYIGLPPESRIVAATSLMYLNGTSRQ